MKETTLIKIRAQSMDTWQIINEIARCNVGIKRATRARDIARYEQRIAILKCELANRK